MKVIIVSPERNLYKGEADSVRLPGAKGRFEVLKGHAPIISSLTAGEVVVGSKEEHRFAIKSGFVEVKNNEVSICVEV